MATLYVPEIEAVLSTILTVILNNSMGKLFPNHDFLKYTAETIHFLGLCV
jgi:hypothetical protein